MSNYLYPRRRVAVASILAGVLILAACASEDEAASDDTSASPTTAAATTTTAPAATTTTAPAATTTTAPAATTTTTVPVEDWSMEAVGPGTFKTAVMEPGFTLTYGEGWVPFQPESRNQLNIEIPESSELGCAPCALLAVNAVEAESPDAVIDFAVSNGVVFADPDPIDVGGIEAQRYEVIGGEGYVFETEFAEFGLDSAEGPARVIVLEANSRVVVIVDLAMPDVADTVQLWSDEVIASIEWSTD